MERLARLIRSGIRQNSGFRFVFAFLMIGATANAGMPIGDDRFGALRAMEPADPLPPAFENGKFQPRQGETVVFLGGTNIVNEQKYGFLETALHLAFPDQQLRVRNLAWQADTVYRQQRPLYFFDAENRDKQAGSTHDLRQRVQPDVVFVCFGKMESLDGIETLETFLKAYGELLDELMQITPRIVMVRPTPFFNSGPAAADSELRNHTLSRFCVEMSDLAEERGLAVIDFFFDFNPEAPFAENGVHLNERGHRKAALRFASQLPGHPKIDFESAATEKLRQAIVAKNQVWHQYHRPTNWAFLYGDRQHVPASRDHEDAEKRWFPFEVENALTLIEKLESEIHELAN